MPTTAAAIITIGLLAGCAQTGVTLSDSHHRFTVDLPYGFTDETFSFKARFKRHGQENPDYEPTTHTDPLLEFGDRYGPRGCVVYVLSFLALAQPHPDSAEAVARWLHERQKDGLSLKNPWARMKTGVGIGLDAMETPTRQILVDSRPGVMASHPGWRMTMRREWPVQPGPLQGVGQTVNLVAEVTPAGSLRPRQWLLANCSASHRPEHVDAYLAEVTDALSSARWQPGGEAGVPE